MKILTVFVRRRTKHEGNMLLGYLSQKTQNGICARLVRTSIQQYHLSLRPGTVPNYRHITVQREASTVQE